jgi:PAS domain S-box-containing protein
MAWSLRPDGVVDFLNQRWMDYTGLSLAEYVADPTGPIHPHDVPRALENWRARMASGEGYDDAMRLRRADGDYRWFLVRTAPLRDASGSVVKWYGVSIDIEDRKRAEEKLSESEMQLSEAQRLAHVGSWAWDLRSGAVTWSDELRRVFGLQQQDAPDGAAAAGGSSQLDLMELVHPEDRDLAMRALDGAFTTGEPYSIYYRVLRRDGAERIVHAIGSVVCDELGTPIKLFGATQDLTARKRAEAELKAQSEQLRALSTRLQAAKEEEATRIAREIHDELGGALTVLKWDLEGIDDRLAELAAAPQVAWVRQKLAAMTALTDTTVETVRRLAAELRPMALDELGLVAAIECQAQQFETRTGIAVRYQCPLEKVDLTSDQSIAVLRILQEAMTNVLRHAQATQVTITAKQEGGDFLLTIADDGRGITASEKSAAHSLGLLGMRERASLIGARIEVAGTAGRGTLVTLRVPIPGS